MKDVFKKISCRNEEENVNETLLNYLSFANDIVTIRKKTEELKPDALKNTSERVGLYINIKKTKPMNLIKQHLGMNDNVI